MPSALDARAGALHVSGEPSRDTDAPPQDDPSPVPNARPLYFGPPQRPLFGWLHAAAAAATPHIGVVICNPFGNEAVCAHRSLRHLAERAAGTGIPTLRFDYDGSGDSAGHDFDPDRLAAWLTSVQVAADELHALTGVVRVCLVGIRLGALLAIQAAAQRRDIAGVATIAPVVSGKAYVRELRMLAKAMDSKRNVARDGNTDILETAGFAMTAATQASVTAVDVGRLDSIPASHILILDRAEMPGGDKWAQHLRGQGVEVQLERVKGYTEMMLDSHESLVPEEILEATLRWLRDIARQPAIVRGRDVAADRARDRDLTRATFQPAATDDPVTRGAPGPAVAESAVLFGNGTKLFGIVTEPRSAPRATPTSMKAVLLLNAGAVHHIGPCRLYVTLARYLAQRGYVVLRMDIAGLGDSQTREQRPENVVYPPEALQDVAEAIDYLRAAHRAVEVHAVGLCSGAYHSYKAAVARMPLTSAILINPLTFFWREGNSLKYSDFRVADDIARYRSNARRLASWMKLLRGQVNLWELAMVLARNTRARLLKPLRSVARVLRVPLREDLPTELLAATRAAIELRFLFAAMDPGIELLRSQAEATAQRLTRRGSLSVELIDGADHTFTDLAARSILAGLIVKRLEGARGRGHRAA
jgi:alpha-beta hydrolase superfamily lysophospholipase